MKTILNKKTGIILEKGEANRLDLISIVLNESSSKGLKILEMRQRFNILDKIDKTKDKNLTLEDSEFEIVKQSFDDFLWAKPHIEILSLSDHLEELSEKIKTK